MGDAEGADQRPRRATTGDAGGGNDESADWEGRCRICERVSERVYIGGVDRERLSLASSGAARAGG